VCFPSEDHLIDTNQNSFHDKLRAMGIEIDSFEKDDFHKVVVEGERIE